jgi:hypothetical protein
MNGTIDNSRIKKKRERWYRIPALILTAMLVIAMVFAVLLNFYGELFFGKILRDKIRQESNGLYRAELDKIRINLFTGKIKITGFNLNPDTVLYKRLKSEHKVRKALYSLSFTSLTLSRPDISGFYRTGGMHLRNVRLENPDVDILAFPDTTLEKKGQVNNLYEDIYPVLSRFFKYCRIDSINIDHGVFYSKQKKKSGRFTEGAYTFSTVLTDFYVNPYSFAEHSRVFYSSDIELRIHDFQYSMADSLYLIRAAEAGFSLKRSRIFGKNIALEPTFNSGRVKEVRGGEFFRISLPLLDISGVDVYKTLLGKQVDIDTVRLENLSINIFHNDNRNPEVRPGPVKGKFRMADLFTVISGNLKSVSVGRLSLDHAKFAYYRDLHDINPEVAIGDVTVIMDHFLLDSLAHGDRSKILYAGEIELRLRDFKLALWDKVHTFTAEKIKISTRESLIHISNTLLFSGNTARTGMKATYYFRLPQLVLDGVDLKKMFNDRKLEFDHLALESPDFRMSTNAAPEPGADGLNTDLRKKLQSDFLYEFVSPYLTSIKANRISLSGGAFQFFRLDRIQYRKVSSGLIELVLRDFVFDSVSPAASNSILSSRDLSIILKDFYYDFQQTGHIVRADRILFSSGESLFEASNLSLKPDPEKTGDLAIDFSAANISITGLNTKKLLEENVIETGDIRLDRPFLSVIERLKPGKKARDKESASGGGNAKPGDLVKSASISGFHIKDGSFYYYRTKGEKKRSVSTDGYDLELGNLFIDLANFQTTAHPVRYDTILLGLPSGVILFDSLYRVSLRSLAVYSHPAGIRSLDFHISTLDKLRGEKVSLGFDLRIRELLIRDFSLFGLIRENDLTASGVSMEHPSGFLELWHETNAGGKLHGITKSLPHSAIKPLHAVYLEKIVLNQADLKVVSHYPDTTIERSLNSVTLQALDYRIDSASGTLADDRILNSLDVRCRVPFYSWVSADGMYSHRFRDLVASTRERTIRCDSLAILPNFSPYDFSRKYGYQKDRLDIRMGHVEILGADFRDILDRNNIRAGKVRIDNVTFRNYRDKRIPFPDWQRRDLVQSMLVKMNRGVDIDTVQLVNGYMDYAEQTGDEPGHVFFDRIDALISPLTNDPERLKKGFTMQADASLFLMGKAPVNASFRFPFPAPNDTFSFSAAIGSISLAEMNPMLAPTQPMIIRSGNEKSTVIAMEGNNDYATGSLVVLYDSLKIEFPKPENNWLNRWKSGIMTFLADDIILPASNPARSGKTREGIIYFERDKRKGFFNYVWKSTLSGLKSTVGLNSKQQREIKRTQKREAQDP